MILHDGPDSFHGDHTLSDQIEKERCLAAGARVEALPSNDGRSSSLMFWDIHVGQISDSIHYDCTKVHFLIQASW